MISNIPSGSNILYFYHYCKPQLWSLTLSLFFTNMKIIILGNQIILKIVWAVKIYFFFYCRIVPVANAILWKLLFINIQQGHFFPQRELIVGKKWKRQFPQMKPKHMPAEKPILF